MADLVESIKENLTFENVLMTAMHTPGVKIDRTKFLKKELIKYYPEEVVSEAVKRNPARAGVSKDAVNKISKDVINYESAKVSGISFAASLPGGVATIGAVSADITSYFVFVLRAVQELAYLYGFEQFDLNENDVDAETMNYLLVFIGVMFGTGRSFYIAKSRRCTR